MTRRSSRRFLPLIVATVAFVTFPALAQMRMDQGQDNAGSSAASWKVRDLTVTSPWTRATPGGAKIAGGYLKITNGGTVPDRFVGATSDAAERVEIHEMSMSDGVMKMRPLPGGVEIKPGETVELKPAGNHLMFVDLRRPLKQGDSIKARLQFQNAGSLEVTFAVNALGASAPQH